MNDTILLLIRQRNQIVSVYQKYTKEYNELGSKLCDLQCDIEEHDDILLKVLNKNDIQDQSIINQISGNNLTFEQESFSNRKNQLMELHA